MVEAGTLDIALMPVIAPGSAGKWRDRWPPHRVLAIFGVASLLVMLGMTPPFMFADEPVHFKRAFGLSQLAIIPERRGGVPGIVAPASIQNAISAYFSPQTPSKLALAFTLDQIQRPLDPGATAFIKLRSDALYPPLAYVPQALAIAIGRAVDAGPVMLLFLARLANLAAAVVLVGYALKTMPLGRETMLLIALLPMSQALLASASPDALTIAGGFVFIAVMLRAMHDDDWSHGRLVTLGATGLLLCSTKYIYLPLLGAGLAVVVTGRRGPQRTHTIVAQLAIAAVATAAAVGWILLNGSLAGNVRPGTDAARQLATAVHDPLGFVGLALRSIRHDAGFLLQSTLGVLGWTNLHLPRWEYLALILAAPLSIGAARDRPRPLPVATLAWFALLIGGVVLLTELGLYMVWTPLASPYIEGVVGRYFLPFLPLVAYIVASLARSARLWLRPDFCYAAMLVILAVTSVTTIARMTQFFGL